MYKLTVKKVTVVCNDCKNPVEPNEPHYDNGHNAVCNYCITQVREEVDVRIPLGNYRRRVKE